MFIKVLLLVADFCTAAEVSDTTMLGYVQPPITNNYVQMYNAYFN